jgi:DNA-binding IclR family transcriptional regulator
LKDEYNIESVGKALSILRAFTSERSEMSISDISRELNLTYSTAFRLVATLEDNSFLYKNPKTLKYSLGQAIPVLNSNYVENYAFKEIAMPFLDSIMKKLGETAILYAVKSVKNNTRICLARVESSHTLRSTTKVNDVLPLTRGSSGPILVANLPLKDQEYLVKLDKVLTLRKLKKIKEDGYIYNDSGRVEGTAGIAVPVFDCDGKLLASMGVTGASYRFDKKDLVTRVTFLKECSAEITKELANND